MRIFLPVLISILLGSHSDYIKAQSKEDKANYRAVKYAQPVDLSIVHEVMYELTGTSLGLPDSSVSYHYTVQYGEHVVYEILQPSYDRQFLGVIIVKSDYKNRTRSFTHVMDNAQKYSTNIDTLHVVLEESTALVEDLCSKRASGKECDSLKLIKHSGDSFIIHVNGKVPNLPSKKLYYPDIKYLPTRIRGVGTENSLLVLEEVITGKQKVDELLKQFSYDGYEVITDEELDFIDDEELKKMQEAFDRLSKKRK